MVREKRAIAEESTSLRKNNTRTQVSESEMGLLLVWLLGGEGLCNLAKDSSCESDLCERSLEIGEKPGVDG